MAIARTTYGTAYNSNGSQTTSVNCGGANLLLVQIVMYTAAPTYNGVALSSLGYDGWYYMVNPPAGANNLVGTTTYSPYFGYDWVAYSGVNTSAFINAHSNGSVGNNAGFTMSVTTTIAGCWVLSTFIGGVGQTGLTTLVGGNNFDGIGYMPGLADSNGPVSIGTTSDIISSDNSGGSSGAIIAIAPAPFINISDTTTISDSGSIVFPKNLTVSDTTAISESVSLGIESPPISSDLQCSMVVSGYKWLTSTLQTAQQNYAVRPYFKAKIIDDAIVPSQTIAPSTLNTGLISYYSMQGNSNDSVGGNNGTDTNVTYGNAYGKIGEGASFNGTNCGIALPYQNIGANVSYSMWVNFASLSGVQIIFSYMNTAISYGGGAITLLPNVQSGATYQASWTPSVSTWYHIVAVQNGMTSEVFINGISLGQQTTQVTNTGNFSQFIGTYMSTTGGGGRIPMNGDIDEVGIWNRALSAGEIGALFNYDVGLAYPFSLTLQGNASSVTGPDGTILSVGFDGSNNVVFQKVSNLHSGTVDSSVQLRVYSADLVPSLIASNQVFDIKTSNWVNGTYRVDVWFFSNFGSSGSQVITQHYYSNDAGSTWANEPITLINVPNTNYSSLHLNLYLAAITPRWNPVTQTVQSGFMYIYPAIDVASHNIVFGPYANGTGTQYQNYRVRVFFGDTTNGYNNSNNGVDWPTNNADSGDWTIHSLDTYRLGSTDHVIISGFRNFADPVNYTTPNYSLWDFEIKELTGSATDVWGLPTSVFSANASVAANKNSFTFPSANVVSTVINGVSYPTVDIVFQATTMSPSVTTLATATTQDYMLIQSIDGVDFTYPSIFTLGGSSFPAGYFFGASYTQQGAYYYILSYNNTTAPAIWELNARNIVADISNDVVTYTIQDVAGQSSSISLQVADQNNMWYPNGTNPGASAIAGGKKIVVEQGFYNASGVPETVPHSVYYIDDVTQNSTSNSNDATITGRDFYRQLSLTITKYAYNIINSLFYSDAFTGTTLNNWNQISGTWTEAVGGIAPTSNPSTDAVITLNQMNPLSCGSLMTVSVQGQTSGHAYVYLAYLDATNWVRLDIIYNVGNTICQVYCSDSASGVVGTSLSASLPSPLNNRALFYPIVIRQHDYLQFEVMVGTTGSTSGNDINAFNQVFTCLGYPSALTLNLASFICGVEIQIADWINGGNGVYPGTPASTPQWTVGLGCNGLATNFKYFRYVQYTKSFNLAELIKTIAVKAGIFTYKIADLIQENFYGLYNYQFTNASVVNRKMVLRPSGVVLSQGNQISDGEIRSVMSAVTSSGGFSLAFRMDNFSSPVSGYRFHVQNYSGFVFVTLEELYVGYWHTLAPTTYNSTGNPALGSLNIDLTIPHEYRAVFIGNWLFFYIDGVEVCGWCENNTTTTSGYPSTGYWGWYSDSGTTLSVSQMTSTEFWKQNPSLSLNPGDDMLSTLTNYLQSLQSWFFSDMFGRLKALFLSSSDPSTYTYQNQIMSAGVDNSNKEYVSQVTVYGVNGLLGIARNNNLMSGVPVREQVIVDYTITTQADANIRAQFALVNANQYQNQLNPKQTMNVGAEIFDSVTVINTGNNSTGTNTGSRVYAETFTTGGQNNECSIEIDTGTL